VAWKLGFLDGFRRRVDNQPLSPRARPETGMITFLCSHCGAPLRTRPELAGTTSHCPRCRQMIQAPVDSGQIAGKSPSESSGSRGKAASPSRSPGGVSEGNSARVSFESVGTARESDFDFLNPPQGPGEIGRLGPYRVLRLLGSGAMGMVFQAEDITLKRQVALKTMKKTQAASEVNRQRFLREAQAAAAIEHDHIVTIYQVGQDRDVPYLAMKLLLGETLEDRLNREGKLPAEEILRIGQEIAEGLAEAHERGLIHRDVKPANIWLEEGRDRVKIVDFGLALACHDDNLLPGDNIPAGKALAGNRDARLTQTNFMVGTPMYMSPEQADAIPDVDHRCDLFSLGGVLYRMATGELPFPGKTTKVVLQALAHKTPRAPIELNPDLPPALSDLIMKLLSKKREERPRSARLVVAALAEIREAPSGYEEVEEEPEEVVEDVVVEPDPEPVRPRPRHRKSKRDRPRHQTDEGALERRVIKLAIFAGIIVFLLLAALVIKKHFFDRKDVEAQPPMHVAFSIPEHQSNGYPVQPLSLANRPGLLGSGRTTPAGSPGR
jgi:serine/threonine protein kinase